MPIRSKNSSLSERQRRYVKLTTSDEDAGRRLDAFLSEKITELSRSTIQKLIKNGAVTYNNNSTTSPKLKITPLAVIEITLPSPDEDKTPQPQDIPLDIIYEDKSIIVINKLPDMVVHPGAGRASGTIVNALLWKYANFAENFDDKNRPGIVHRLDRETSGCMIIAKDQLNLDKLISLFKRHKIEKRYIAIVAGHLKNKTGTLTSNIGRHNVNRKKMAVLEHGGKEAITHYKVIDEFTIKNLPVSSIEVNLETGRTHQIRVHMASIGHPVLGDKIYGGRQKLNFTRQLLHAWNLKIIHPETREEMNFTAPLPEDMKRLVGESVNQ